MAKIYTVSCREVGMDCDFKTDAAEHDMHGFGNELYIKMRQHVHIEEEQTE